MGISHIRLAAEEHCIERAWERYRLNLTHADVSKMSDLIACGGGVKFSIVSRDKGRDSEGYLIEFAGKVLPVIYSPKVGTCLTVLPPNNRNLQRAYVASMMLNKREGKSKCRSA
jgi:hypothetical protein